MQHKLPVLVLATVLLAASAFTSATVTPAGWETKFTASDGATYDEFGRSVAMSGDNVLIGAFRDDDAGSSSGSAYLFQPDGSGGWSEHKFTASDAAAGAAFGFSVALSGDNVLIGAPYHGGYAGGYAGSAYLYQPDGSGGWSEHKFTASDAASRDYFGVSVAVSGDNVLIGAFRDDDAGSESGSAYLFQPDGSGGWSEHKFTASDGAKYDEFGRSVAVSGDNVLIGAWGDDDRVPGSGSAYLFQPDGSGGWSEHKFTASDAARGQDFGWSVAVSGDNVLIGAYHDASGGSISGSAYLFQPDGSGDWNEHKFTATDAAAYDVFGESVALSGDNVLIGAWGDDDAGDRSGSAYLYQPDGLGGWSEHKFTASDAATADDFGFSVALSGDNVLIGARYDDDRGSASGSAYLYDLAADTDGDGLSDGDEVNTHGTDPLNPDTDGDSLSDGDEVNTHGTDPLNADTDGDGLGDGDEVNSSGTDPLNADTDGDGLSDGDEVNTHGTDPLNADTDGDGLSDGDEVNTHGTDPLNPDTDGDGLTDGDEVNTHGTDPLNPDTDGDGQGDGYEVWSGSDPTDAKSISTPAGPISLPVPLPVPVPEF